MAKKKNENELEAFDLTKALEECPKPDWFKRAFVKVMDTGKVKSQEDLIKLMEKFGGMK